MDIPTLAKWTGYVIWGAGAALLFVTLITLALNRVIRECGLYRDLIIAARNMYRERRAKKEKFTGA